jgi:hypothetical protein
MTDAELNFLKAEIEREKSELEKAKLDLERSFAKKWAAPVLGFAGVIIAAFLSLAAVAVTTIIKDKEEMIKDKENALVRAQTEATATNEAKNRLDRLKLDYANFLMNNWAIFSTGNNIDRQALVFVSGELFPTYVSKYVVRRLYELIPGTPDPALSEAIDSLRPPYDLTGTWMCTAKCQGSNPASIQQNLTGLIFTSEVGSVSTGVYKTRTTVAAIEWGDLGGIVRDDGCTINWFDSRVWKKQQSGC